MPHGDGLHRRGKYWHGWIQPRHSPDGRRHEWATGETDFKLARDKYIRHLAELRSQALPTDQAAWPLEKALEKYIERASIGKAESTASGLRVRMKALVAGFGKDALLSQLATPERLMAYQVARSAGAAASSVNTDINLLRAVLREARLWARLQDSYKPLRLTEEEIDGPGKALTEEELQRIWRAVESHPRFEEYGIMARLARHLGMRSKEILNLRHASVYLDSQGGGYLDIAREMTKTRKGVRKVWLTPAERPLVERAVMLAMKKGSVNPEHYLFPLQSSRGVWQPGHPRNEVGHVQQQIARLAGVKFRFHDFRHTRKTELDVQGHSERVVDAYMGHQPGSGKRYTHVSPEDVKAMVAEGYNKSRLQ